MSHIPTPEDQPRVIHRAFQPQIQQKEQQKYLEHTQTPKVHNFDFFPKTQNIHNNITPEDDITTNHVQGNNNMMSNHQDDNDNDFLIPNQQQQQNDCLNKNNNTSQSSYTMQNNDYQDDVQDDDELIINTEDDAQQQQQQQLDTEYYIKIFQDENRKLLKNRDELHRAFLTGPAPTRQEYYEMRQIADARKQGGNIEDIINNSNNNNNNNNTSFKSSLLPTPPRLPADHVNPLLAPPQFITTHNNNNPLLVSTSSISQQNVQNQQNMQNQQQSAQTSVQPQTALGAMCAFQQKIQTAYCELVKQHHNNPFLIPRTALYDGTGVINQYPLINNNNNNNSATMNFKYTGNLFEDFKNTSQSNNNNNNNNNNNQQQQQQQHRASQQVRQ
eukprot:UN03714